MKLIVYSEASLLAGSNKTETGEARGKGQEVVALLHLLFPNDSPTIAGHIY